ncbi:MAG: hypothetical protein EDM05_009325 [Leptolyngbya sp. IPPAS B-1204]|uniref:Uncharacterized protein n=1 Tax=Leptolyngbya sp. NK1-12 TaxID=2547451 RepID=A0AA97APG1_9CYAN|nr:hypothetical protein [Leptolyngbya sp. NK1-12]MBF2050964.1 hypothetical protein [Elainella sp. C42_A2020_010]RNJ66498.1 MAG: hypothetical protein EDM05_25465 [Leptolyngbya sp. IPPAS B-1204]WNZ21528.1 hypothetical protein HJG54_00705 [Leptolyngbya sp. NK1-12]
MKQQYFSDSEWVTLLQSPTQAILAVILADKTDPVSFLKEMQAAFQILAAELQRQDISSDLIKAMIASINDAIGQSPLQGEDLLLQQQFELIKRIQAFSSVSDGQNQVVEHFKQVKDILLNKVPIVQAEEFKQWILELATQVAKAVKEEGIWGIGGERVSRQESGALSTLEKTLTFR